MKPACDGYDNATFIKSNIKPDNQEVAIEIEINTNDSHYNTNRGQAIAASAEIPSKRDEEDERIFDRFVQNSFLFLLVLVVFKVLKLNMKILLIVI